MRMNSSRLLRRVKKLGLSLAVVGTLHGAACTWSDVGLNIVNGGLSFVKGYTMDILEAVTPPADAFGAE